MLIIVYFLLIYIIFKTIQIKWILYYLYSITVI